MVGWLKVVSWQALVASVAYISATLIQGLLMLNYPSYRDERWYSTLLSYTILAFSLFVNTYIGRFLPQIESTRLFFYILGLFGVLIPLVYLAPH